MNRLNEGGFGGHMAHLYENPELTFKQIKDVFEKASAGELEGTELLKQRGESEGFGGGGLLDITKVLWFRCQHLL